MGKGTRELAIIAAKWWAERVDNANRDDKSTEESKGASNLAVQPANRAAIEKFAACLSDLIEAKLNQEDFNEVYSEFALSFDANKSDELRKAAEDAGISNQCFPDQAHMQISRNHISVISEYNSSLEFLYASKVYWRLEIERLNQGIERYRSGEVAGYFQDEHTSNTWVNKRIKKMQKNIEEYQEYYNNAED